MVIEQGTIMDRIDENISDTKVHAVKGNEQITQLLAKETSQRATKCIVCLI